MASQAQIQANRRNSLRSTGPRTPEGKARSARNSYKHGLTAQHLILSIEDRGEFEEFRARLFREHQPVGTLETLLVSQIAAGFYRMQEAASMTMATYENELTHTEGATVNQTKVEILDRQAPRFALLRRYDAAATSLYFRSIAQLTKLQALRRRTGDQLQAIVVGPPPLVIQVTDENGDPPPIGFVSQCDASASTALASHSSKLTSHSSTVPTSAATVEFRALTDPLALKRPRPGSSKTAS
jgi:hypothetical protein